MSVAPIMGWRSLLPRAADRKSTLDLLFGIEHKGAYTSRRQASGQIADLLAWQVAQRSRLR